MAAKTTNYWRSHLNQNLRTQLSSQASVTIIMSRFQLYAYLHSVYNAIREHILNDHELIEAVHRRSKLLSRDMHARSGTCLKLHFRNYFIIWSSYRIPYQYELKVKINPKSQ